MHTISADVWASVHLPESNGSLGLTTPLRVEAPAATPASCWRHSGWKADRDRVYRSLQRTGQPSHRIDEFETCGDRVYVLQNKTDDSRFTLAGSGCHDRFCLPCAQCRSRLIARRVIAKIEGSEARFLTLTLRTGAEPLADSLDRLYTAFAALRRSRLWRTRVSGGVAFLEIKWMPETQRWHPHLHVLTQGLFIPHGDLKAEWHRVTGDSTVVDIRLARNLAKVGEYVTKYASKPFNSSFLADDDRLDEAVLALKGRRLATTFGDWRGYPLTLPDDDREWHVLGTLQQVAWQAQQGDSVSRSAMASLDPKLLDDLLPDERSPPVVQPAVPAAYALQATLFPLSWSR